MGRISNTKLKLVDTAMGLFLTKSYHGVGVQQICDEAGVNKGSFYHFFPTKLDLAIEVMHAYRAAVDQLFEPSKLATTSSLEKIESVFDTLHRFQTESLRTEGKMFGCPVGNLALELSHTEEKIRQVIQSTLNYIAHNFTELVDEAIAGGELPKDTDSQSAGRFLAAYFEGVILYAKTHRDPDLIYQFKSGLLRLLQPSSGQLARA